MATTSRDDGNGVSYNAIYGLVPSRRSTATPVWIEDRGRWFADSKERPGHAHGIIRVITQRFEAERAKRAVERNPLSGAFGRPEFVEHLTRQLNMSGRHQAGFAVLLIGIEVGDGPDMTERLAAAVDRLRAQMRAHEVCARHAANRFAVLLESCSEDQAAAAAARFIEAIEAAPAGAPIPRAGDRRRPRPHARPHAADAPAICRGSARSGAPDQWSGLRPPRSRIVQSCGRAPPCRSRTTCSPR